MIMERNNELIDKVLDYLEQHPKEWNQTSWMTPCGTQACFAGHAMLLSGYGVSYMVVHHADGDHDCEVADCRRVPRFVDPSGHRILIDEDLEANKLLGFTEAEGNSIYYRNFRDVKALRRHIDTWGEE
jgi:hypothetical protein